MAYAGFKRSLHDYELWLRDALDGDIVKGDLKKKHEKMAKSAFAFLRATYWRWAETIYAACPQLKSAAAVLGIGDIHLENFGSWRDGDGRLVWGVNDFDEAHEMPYALDLVRLAASAILARRSHDTSEREICKKIVEGYLDGLSTPRAFVLDLDHAWLRQLVAVSDEERAKFWDDTQAKPDDPKAPTRYAALLRSAMPRGFRDFASWPRSAGLGSLGRPRWVAMASWQDGPIVREAKALAPSAWSYVHGGRAKIVCGVVASGRHRSPDPKYQVVGSVVVRRLSPNNRKIEVAREPFNLLSPRMLRAMGYEIANIHRGHAETAPIRRDLDKRPNGWLREAAIAAVKVVKADYEAWLREVAPVNGP